MNLIINKTLMFVGLLSVVACSASTETGESDDQASLSGSEPAVSNGNGSETTPSGSNDNGSETTPSVSSGNGSETTPSVSSGNGSETTPSGSNDNGSETTPSGSNDNGSETTPSGSNDNGSETTPSVSSGNGSETTPSVSSGNGSETTPSVSSGNGSETTPSGSNDNGSETTPSVSSGNGSEATPDPSSTGSDTMTVTNNDTSVSTCSKQPLSIFKASLGTLNQVCSLDNGFTSYDEQYVGLAGGGGSNTGVTIDSQDVSSCVVFDWGDVCRGYDDVSIIGLRGTSDVCGDSCENSCPSCNVGATLANNEKVLIFYNQREGETDPLTFDYMGTRLFDRNGIAFLSLNLLNKFPSRLQHVMVCRPDCSDASYNIEIDGAEMLFPDE